jgi:hypothetical protein
MIDNALVVLTDTLSSYLKHLPELIVGTEGKAELTHLVKYDGSIAAPDNSLGVLLINIEEERVTKSQKAFTTDANGQITHTNPELKLNLYILIVANWADYKTGLHFLSGAIRFFQSKNVFTPQDTPQLDPGIEKLIVEMSTLSFEQQNHLWGALGAKYLPSVIYKVRMLAIQEAQIADSQLPIVSIEHSERYL